MEKYLIKGGTALRGVTKVSGAKNVALKTLVAACLTDEEVTIHNIPLISDFSAMVAILKELGASVTIEDHTARIKMQDFKQSSISLEKASHARTSAMFIAPLLARTKEAHIPNPGGCRLGARPIDRIIDGLVKMNAEIVYNSEDGYFHGKTAGFQGITYEFEKNTHMGTETMIIAAVLAKGTTILKNAAEEPEIDDLITLLNAMGAQVKRSAKREITIEGVEKLHGTEFSISPDRNEVVTFAIAALVTKGDITIQDAQKAHLSSFLEKLAEAGGGYEETGDGIRFFYNNPLKAVDVTTAIHPGFMTDWQAPWAVLMTQAEGTATIHETVFENKLGYIKDLKKMGARAELFNPPVTNKADVYNFNLDDDKPEYYHAVRISGPTKLHDAIVTMHDIRAGAAVVLAALAAKGETVIHNIHLIRRGYESFDDRLNSLGADVRIVTEE
jgi:UDP-N-acetylglucosamine 1-carboxyvinyltransferase